MPQQNTFERKERIRADGTAYCHRCRTWVPATPGHRLDCPRDGIGRMVVERKRVSP